MSRYIIKYMNLEKSKRPTFWDGGSIYDEINYISNLLLTSCQRPNIYVNLFAFFLDIYDGAAAGAFWFHFHMVCCFATNIVLSTIVD